MDNEFLLVSTLCLPLNHITHRLSNVARWDPLKYPNIHFQPLRTIHSDEQTLDKLNFIYCQCNLLMWIKYYCLNLHVLFSVSWLNNRQADLSPCSEVSQLACAPYGELGTTLQYVCLPVRLSLSISLSLCMSVWLSHTNTYILHVSLPPFLSHTHEHTYTTCISLSHTHTLAAVPLAAVPCDPSLWFRATGRSMPSQCSRISRFVSRSLGFVVTKMQGLPWYCLLLKMKNNP